MDKIKIEAILYNSDSWKESVGTYNSYGPEFIAWLSAKTSLPVWMIYLLILTLLIFLSVKIVDKFFSKKKCTGRHYFWTSLVVLSITSLGLFAPNITNKLEYLTRGISGDWFITLIPNRIQTIYLQGYSTLGLFADNIFNCCAYYFTAAIALISIFLLIFKRNEKELDFFTELGFWLFIISLAIILLISFIFIVIPGIWFITGLLITILINIHIIYYPVAYSITWSFLFISNIVFKLGVVIKSLILLFAVLLCIRSIIKLS